MSRPAGKLGLKPIVHHPELYAHRFGWKGAANPPASGDVSGGLTKWGMDGNGPDPDNLPEYPEGAGDCGPAMTDHGRRIHGGTMWGTAGTQTRYAAYGESQGWGKWADDGVENVSWLSWCLKQEIAEKGEGADDLIAFMELDLESAPDPNATVHQAMIDFHGVFVAVALTDDAQQIFSERGTWTVANGERPDPNEGHDILLVKYDGSTDTYVTWSELQKATHDWSSACRGQALVFLTREDAASHDIDFDALLTEIRAEGGDVNPDVPTPAPVPTPTPTPTPVPGNYVQGCRDQLKKAADAIEVARQALGVEHSNRKLTKAQRLILQGLDGPLRVEEEAIEAFLAVPAP